MQQELQQSIQRHEQYVKIDPHNVLLKQALGDLYHRAGRFEDAVACYEQCLTTNPHDFAARSRLGLVMISQHRFAEAEQQLRSMFDAGDRDPALAHNLGLTLYFQRRFDEARQLFIQAAAAGLTDPSNFAYLARTHHHLGEIAEAIAAGERWFELAPDAQSQGYLALLHMDNGDMKICRELATSVLTQDQDNIDANIVFGSALIEDQEMDRARICFETVLRNDRENGRAWLGLGLVHLYEQRYPQAINALQNAVKIHPSNSGMIVTLGWAQLVNKEFSVAEEIFKYGLSVDRTFSESHAGLAAAYALQNKFTQAQTEVDLAKRLDRNSIGAEIALSFVLAARGNQQAAAESFTKVLQRSPQEGLLPLIDHLKIYSRKQMLKKDQTLARSAVKH